MTRILATGLLLAMVTSIANGADAPPVVNAPAGKLRGASAGKVQVFKGIPYAQPPVGALRWKPPLPAAKWQGTLDATQYGAACIQPKGRPDSIYFWNLTTTSED
jgi:para-nitrobenzyl esterase